jgi:protein associated with RNAse G/E
MVFIFSQIRYNKKSDGGASMLSIGQIVTVCSFKHDGSVHRVWDSNQVVAIQEDCLVLGNFLTGVIESDGRRWQTK